MSFPLLIRKLHLEKNKIVKDDLLREYCKLLEMDYHKVITYLVNNKYLIRILRGIFYIKSADERKYDKCDIYYLDALKEALKIKGVDNWYLGLESAIKRNNLTHEFFVVDYILNDTIFRAKTITVMGHKVKFIKLKPELCSFGINEGKFPYSDVEKTLLDFIYLMKYKGFEDSLIKSKLIDYMSLASKDKLLFYAKHYNKKVEEFVRLEWKN
jgi:hypothetical protein